MPVRLYSASCTHAPVTPSDATTFSTPFNALHIGGAGSVVVTSPKGVDATFAGLAAGQRLQVAGIKVKATGTTATLIVAIFDEQ